MPVSFEGLDLKFQYDSYSVWGILTMTVVIWLFKPYEVAPTTLAFALEAKHKFSIGFHELYIDTNI